MSAWKKIAGGALAVVAATIIPLAAHADPEADSRLTQQITAGALSTDIRDASGNILSNPSFPMSGVIVSTDQQLATGTFGSNSQRVTMDNPGGANGGWSLTWSATVPGTSVWVSGADSYAYNGTAATGQLSVNPAVGDIEAVVGSNTGITLGASASFTGSTPVTLVTADAASDDVWKGYITGVGLSQSIPAGQPAGSYTLDMTQTIAAI